MTEETTLSTIHIHIEKTKRDILANFCREFGINRNLIIDYLLEGFIRKALSKEFGERSTIVAEFDEKWSSSKRVHELIAQIEK